MIYRRIVRKLVITWEEVVALEEYDTNAEYEENDGWEDARDLLVDSADIAQHAKECLYGRIPHKLFFYIDQGDDTMKPTPVVSNFEWDIHTEDYPEHPVDL